MAPAVPGSTTAAVAAVAVAWLAGGWSGKEAPGAPLPAGELRAPWLPEVAEGWGGEELAAVEADGGEGDAEASGISPLLNAFVEVVGCAATPATAALVVPLAGAAVAVATALGVAALVACAAICFVAGALSLLASAGAGLAVAAAGLAQVMIQFFGLADILDFAAADAVFAAAFGSSAARVAVASVAVGLALAVDAALLAAAVAALRPALGRVFGRRRLPAPGASSPRLAPATPPATPASPVLPRAPPSTPATPRLLQAELREASRESATPSSAAAEPPPPPPTPATPSSAATQPVLLATPPVLLRQQSASESSSVCAVQDSPSAPVSPPALTATRQLTPPRVATPPQERPITVAFASDEANLCSYEALVDESRPAICEAHDVKIEAQAERDAAWFASCHAQEGAAETLSSLDVCMHGSCEAEQGEVERAALDAARHSTCEDQSNEIAALAAADSCMTGAVDAAPVALDAVTSGSDEGQHDTLASLDAGVQGSFDEVKDQSREALDSARDSSHSCDIVALAVAGDCVAESVEPETVSVDAVGPGSCEGLQVEAELPASQDAVAQEVNPEALAVVDAAKPEDRETDVEALGSCLAADVAVTEAAASPGAEMLGSGEAETSVEAPASPETARLGICEAQDCKAEAREVLDVAMLGSGEAHSKEVPLVAAASAEGAAAAMAPAAVGGDASGPGAPTAKLKVNGVEYVLLRKIGRGGSSKVYRVEGPAGELLALKCVRVASPADFDRLWQEVTLLMQFRGCPRVVQVVDASTDAERANIYIVMELGETDLAQYLRSGPRLSVATLQDLWAQMLQAVADVHRGSVLHLDLKPGNFLFVGDQLKLIDFGIAERLQPGCDSVVRDSSMATVSYVPPEAISQGKVRLSMASDVWSLGVILHEMACGEVPLARLDPMQKVVALSQPDLVVDLPCDDALAALDFDAVGDVVAAAAARSALRGVLAACLRREPSERPRLCELLRTQLPFSQPMITHEEPKPLRRRLLLDDGDESMQEAGHAHRRQGLQQPRAAVGAPALQVLDEHLGGFERPTDCTATATSRALGVEGPLRPLYVAGGGAINVDKQPPAKVLDAQGAGGLPAPHRLAPAAAGWAAKENCPRS